MSGQETDAEQKFAELWAVYEPKVRKMAMSYKIDGAVGAELDDLVQIAQALMLHALRKYDPAKAQFNTYYYACLKNEYVHLLKRCFPKRRYLIVSFDPATGQREIIKVQSPRGERTATDTELESLLSDLRSRGLTYSVIPWTPKTRYPLLDSMVSTDAATKAPGDGDSSVSTVGDIIAAPEEPLTVDEIVERISHRIPDAQLRQIAVWLFEGHKMSGRDGIMRRTGLKKHQAERALHRIRMLLAGEFGVTVANQEAL